MSAPDPAAVRALFASIARAPREIAAFAYFDPEWRLLGMRHAMPGRSDAVDVPLRAVARDAVVLGAAAVAMAHNHPSGNATPSRADLVATRRLATALATLEVSLVEHLVLAGEHFTSLRERGLL